MKNLNSLIVIAFIAILALMLTGCTATSEAVKKTVDEFGDSAHSGFALIDIWEITPSDAANNGTPTGKKVTVIGNIDTIPLVGKNGETVKDYAKYHKTETPAWYNSSNVTKEELFICTGDNAKEIVAFAKLKLQGAANAAKTPANNTAEPSAAADSSAATK